MPAETKFRTCNLCEAMCGLRITVDGGAITRIEGDPDDVLSRGHVCPKAFALKELLEDPDRVRRPLRRTPSGSFEEVSWDSAIGEAAERIAALQSAHGKDAFGAYWGNPTVHSHGTILMVTLFSQLLGSRNKFDANSADANPKLFACERLYGDMAALTVPDIDRTDFFLMLGANPLASNGSLMSLGDVRGRLQALARRGAKLIVVDPRRTETAKIADKHLPIRPGTDAALLLGMLHVLFSKGFIDDVAVGKIATGLADLRAAVTPFSPERAARATGIDAATIADLASQLASAKRAVVYGRVGICTGPSSAATSWLIEALNVVTGNFDRPGGMMFPTPAVDLSTVARWLKVGGAGRFHSRVRGLPEVGGQLPAATLADEIETEGHGQIRGLLTVAGNPVLSVPNGERLSRALGKLDFMVSVDPYINATTRHAHLILPPTPALARGHYDLVLHAVAVRNTAKWSDPTVPPEPDAKDDWDILRSLGLALSKARGGAWVAAAGAVDLLNLTSEKAIDLLLRLGPYGDKLLPFRKGLSLRKLRESPHGVDLGPLVPMRAKRVHKPDHKVDLAAPDVLADLRRIDVELERAPASQAGQPRDGLLLIGRRHLRSNNSWMHNCPSLVKGPSRTSLLVHPEDAAALGLDDGGEARIRSRVGAVTARVQVTDEVTRGVVSLPHGYGHSVTKDTTRVAAALGGPNMNALTDEMVVDSLTGTAVLNGVPVHVEPLRDATRPLPGSSPPAGAPPRDTPAAAE